MKENIKDDAFKYAKQWLENDYFDLSDREKLKKTLSHLPETQEEILELFSQDLEFGTGGLRAPMGFGKSCINKYTIRKATQALCDEVREVFSRKTQDKILGGTQNSPSEPIKAVISFDSRHNSKEFALEAAQVFAGNGIKAFVFEQLTPTPMLSYAVRHLDAHCGIMITASHNPPIYNGYKVFWSDGAQVVPPVDQHIIERYNNLHDWKQIKMSPSLDQAFQDNLITWVHSKVDDDFYQMIQTNVIQDHNLCFERGEELGIVYTALHGSAAVPCEKIAHKLGFKNFYSVAEQVQPDGNFSTVSSPNPEDPSALKMAVDSMIQNKKDIAFGTDPDGDRLGVVINHHQNPYYLTGNQIGVLFVYYMLQRKKEFNLLPSRPTVIKSIVTTPLQDVIVKDFGGEVLETLTGFKWMAKLIRDLEEQKSSYHFIFASEESFGYMPHKEARDKDGVSSLALMCEVALYYKVQGKTLVDVLDEIYSRYGFYQESLLSKNYEGRKGKEKISRIMEYFRNLQDRHFADQMIISKEDFLTSQKTDLISHDVSSISHPKSNVLSFTLEDGSKFFLRPSGTEPKIKFYTMVREKMGDLEAQKKQAFVKIKNIENLINNICETV